MISNQLAPMSAMASNPRLEPLLEGVQAVADDFRRELAGCPDAAVVA